MSESKRLPYTKFLTAVAGRYNREQLKAAWAKYKEDGILPSSKTSVKKTSVKKTSVKTSRKKSPIKKPVTKKKSPAKKSPAKIFQVEAPPSPSKISSKSPPKSPFVGIIPKSPLVGTTPANTPASRTKSPKKSPSKSPSKSPKKSPAKTQRKNIRTKLAESLKQARQKKTTIEQDVVAEAKKQQETPTYEKIHFWTENEPEGLTNAMSRPEGHTWYITQNKGVVIIEPTYRFDAVSDETIADAVRNVGFEIQKMVKKNLPDNLTAIEISYDAKIKQDLVVWSVREALGLES